MSPKQATECVAATPNRTALDLLDEAARFIEGYAGSAESGFVRQRRALAWLRDFYAHREAVAQRHQELDESWFADTIAELRVSDCSVGLFPADTDDALASDLALAVADHFRTEMAVRHSSTDAK